MEKMQTGVWGLTGFLDLQYGVGVLIWSVWGNFRNLLYCIV
jgi:hypothetical protein